MITQTYSEIQKCLKVVQYKGMLDLVNRGACNIV